MNLSGLARGSYPLKVRATDVYGAVGTAMITFTVDRPPTLAIAAPIEGRVARPSLPVDVTCTDDDPAGCASIQVSVGGTTLASGRAAVSTTVTPPAQTEGMSITVVITGTDSAGRSVTENRRAFVENGAGLSELLRVPGTVLDFDGGKVLFQNAAQTALILRDRASSMETVAAWGLTKAVSEALIYKSGVVYQVEGRGVAHWKGAGNPVTLGTAVVTPAGPTASNTFKMAGPYVAFRSTVDAKGSIRPVRHHLDTGEMLILNGDRDFIPGPGPTSRSLWFDLAANGDVVYNPEASTTAHLYRQATQTYGTVPDAPSGMGSWHEEPITNGSSVMFAFMTRCPPTCPLGYGIALVTSAGTLVEVARSNPTIYPRSGRDFMLAEGWSAFTRSRGGNDAVVQAWTRSPDGVETDCSTLTRPVSLAGLAPSGEILFDSGRRYRSSASSLPPTEVGGAQGKVAHKDGEFHVILGDTLFRVLRSAGDGSTPPDLGGADIPGRDAAVDAQTPAPDLPTPLPDAGADVASNDAGIDMRTQDGFTSDLAARDVGGIGLSDGSGGSAAGCQCSHAGGRGAESSGCWLIAVVTALSLGFSPFNRFCIRIRAFQGACLKTPIPGPAGRGATSQSPATAPEEMRAGGIQTGSVVIASLIVNDADSPTGAVPRRNLLPPPTSSSR